MSRKIIFLSVASLITCAAAVHHSNAAPVLPTDPAQFCPEWKYFDDNNGNCGYYGTFYFAGCVFDQIADLEMNCIGDNPNALCGDDECKEATPPSMLAGGGGQHEAEKSPYVPRGVAFNPSPATRKLPPTSVGTPGEGVTLLACSEPFRFKVSVNGDTVYLNVRIYDLSINRESRVTSFKTMRAVEVDATGIEDQYAAPDSFAVMSDYVLQITDELLDDPLNNDSIQVITHTLLIAVD